MVFVSSGPSCAQRVRPNASDLIKGRRPNPIYQVCILERRFCKHLSGLDGENRRCGGGGGDKDGIHGIRILLYHSLLTLRLKRGI